MRVSFVCNDTWGGVQPYLALARGLARLGHQVQMVAPEGFRAAIEAAGLPHAGIEGDVRANLQRPEVLDAMERGFLATHRLMVRMMDQTVRVAIRDCMRALEGQDLVVCGFGGMLAAQPVAEKLGIPLLQAHLQPLFTTSAYPGLLSMRALSGVGVANRVSHAFTRQVFWQPLRGAISRARRDLLGLPPAPLFGRAAHPQRPGQPVLFGYSPSLLPQPRDAAPEVHVTGYWFPDRNEAWQPPAHLAAFMNSGPPPVAVGFGSMSAKDPKATADLVLQAAERAGCRVVLLSGWDGMQASQLPSWACVVEHVPHEWLYPRCAAAVHHGGAGTTGASVRAGVPTIIVPFAADQPFWAWLVTQRGVGLSAGARKRLTPQRLAAAMKQALADTAMRGRAAALGHAVQQEDGVALGAKAIHQYLRR